MVLDHYAPCVASTPHTRNLSPRYRRFLVVTRELRDLDEVVADATVRPDVGRLAHAVRDRPAQNGFAQDAPNVSQPATMHGEVRLNG